MLTIKILGPGCDNCRKLESTVKQAVAMLGVPAAVRKVIDRDEISGYHILATPGLVVDEKLVAAGRLPDVAEVTTWLVDALEREAAG